MDLTSDCNFPVIHEIVIHKDIAFEKCRKWAELKGNLWHFFTN